MFHKEWGYLTGDDDADAIMRQRKDERRTIRIVGVVLGLLLWPCLIWLGFTGSDAALAFSLFFGVSLLINHITETRFELMTWVMVAEQRVRNIEGVTADTSNDVHNLDRLLNR